MAIAGAFRSATKRGSRVLQRVTQFPDEAWQALVDAGTTHVIVHEAALPAAEVDVPACMVAGAGCVRDRTLRQ